jgi:predicted DNA-binding protein YlxM (UPF0122 family)
MDKNIQVSMLLEMYGKLLTDKQVDVIDLYYNQNLSLSEIAEELNITRQGVRKSLVDGEKKLLDIEEKLGFMAQKERREKIINDIYQKTFDKSLRKKLLNLL